VKAYAPPRAPILPGQRQGPAPLGRTPGRLAAPTAGVLVATRGPVGQPRDARAVRPWVAKVPAALERRTAPLRRALPSVAGARGGHAPGLRQALQARGLLRVGIPPTVAPLTPQPRPEEMLDLLHEAGVNRQRPPHQVQRACACGSSRPVVARHIARARGHGAGQLRDKGPQGAGVPLGLPVMAHNGAAVGRSGQQRRSKRAQKFRRGLGLRRRHGNQINRSKN
jgi:hypothetical protein